MPYSGRRVLVAGSTGLVGMGVTRLLVERGARVRATVHSSEPPVRFDGVEYVNADLTREEDCLRVVRDVDDVFMAAANTSGAATIAGSPLVHVTPNVVMNTLFLDACYRAEVQKVLCLGSTTAYPDTGDRPVREEELFHGDPYGVYYPVGWMKRHLEVLARMYSEKLRRPMCVQVIRPSNIYGPFDDFRWKTSHVLAALIRKVVERHDPIEVWGTGDDVRDVIYIDDFARACLDILEKSRSYDPVNVALGKGYSVKEMLKILCEEDGREDPKIVFNPAKPSMIPVRLVNVEKAERVFGFRAKTDLREGVRLTMKWYRENGEILRKKGIPGDERV